LKTVVCWAWYARRISCAGCGCAAVNDLQA
jgi:hypothetical protein